MANKRLVLIILGWLILLLGMLMFLFTKETILIVQIFAVSCCIVSFVLFRLEGYINS